MAAVTLMAMRMDNLMEKVIGTVKPMVAAAAAALVVVVVVRQ